MPLVVAAAAKRLSSVEVLWPSAFEEVEVGGDNVSNELREQAHAGDSPYVGVVKDPEVRRAFAQELGQDPAETGVGVGRVAGQNGDTQAVPRHRLHGSCAIDTVPDTRLREGAGDQQAIVELVMPADPIPSFTIGAKGKESSTSLAIKEKAPPQRG